MAEGLSAAELAAIEARVRKYDHDASLLADRRANAAVSYADFQDTVLRMLAEVRRLQAEAYRERGHPRYADPCENDD